MRRSRGMQVPGLLLVAIASLAAYACSGRVASTTPSDGGGVSDAGSTGDAASAEDAASDGATDASCGLGKPASPPLQHRPSAVACGLSAPSYPPPGDSCTSDAGCGTIPVTQTCRAYPDAGGATFCNGDQCFTDSDCPNGPCGCSVSTPQLGVHNLCYFGNCHTDADCGSGGYCSPSRQADCQGGDDPGVEAYYCHTPKDECTNDSDCASCGTGGYCAVTLLGFWQCIAASQLPMCPSG